LAPNVVGLSSDKVSKTPFQADAHNRCDNTSPLPHDAIDQRGGRSGGPATTAHHRESSKSTPEQQLAVTADNILAGPLPCGEAMHTDTASVTSVIPRVVLRGEEYLPTFSGDPDEDPEIFITEIREFFAAPQNVSLPKRVKARLAHRQLRGRAAKANLFFLTRDRTISDLEGRLLEEFGAEANFAELYEELKRGTLGWEEPVEVFFARKTALYRRLFPDAPKARLVKELINQMPHQARPTLTGQCPQRVY
jgi:hypothetical protein